MSDRHTADTITDDALDQLYAQLDELHQEIAAAGTALADMARKRNEQMDRADRAEAALDRVRAAADRLADGTEAGFRAALTIREALADPCKQHPNAPTIAGMCGGCTQYPTDKPATA
jgi:chromosome segregation ATPase